jgi:hypothetical protein
MRLLAIVALTVTLVCSLAPATAQGSGPSRAQIDQAFVAIHEAEAEGGNVTPLISTLNQAINLTQTADRLNATNPQGAASLYSRASSLTSNVLQSAKTIAAQGRTEQGALTIGLYEETGALGALALVVYFVTPEAYWRIWLRIHRESRVKRV